ncbi:MAG: penicillin acylase family protein [Saprospiraceae bacterium]
MKHIGAILLLILLLATVLLLNGNLSGVLGKPQAFGKLLDPINGIWNGSSEDDEYMLASPYHTDQKIQIKYDQHYVPHIYARELKDLLYAQGYLEAKDRLFEMQFLKAAAAGELSEWFGEKTIELDKKRRKSGLPIGAENSVKSWNENKAELALYQAYVDGVNNYITHLSPSDYPFEFKLFNKSPKKWDLLSSAYIFKYMANILAGGNSDIEMTNMRILLGEDLFNNLYRETEKKNVPVIRSEVYDFDTIYGMSPHQDTEYRQILYKASSSKRPHGVGSNNWTVTGSKSSSGRPILCNDPHLSLTIPSIWYEINLITDDFNAYGVSFPGMPAIMIGFNDDIAWGETNVGQDVEDLFVIEWVDSTRSEYVLNGKKYPVQFRKEVIKVSGEEDLELNVKYTKWGPVVHESDHGNQDLAKRWLVLDVPDQGEASTFIHAMQCKDYDCYWEKTEHFGTPAQNFIFASKSGDIGLRVNGKFPARHHHDGRFVEWGNDSLNDWKAFYPREQNPQMKNPDKGYLFSANQRSADTTFPYYYTGSFERYRNKVIDSLLKNNDSFDVKQMQKMHQNVFSLKAANFIPVMLSYLGESRIKNNPYLNILSQWDYNYTPNSTAATIFELLYSTMENKVWDEILAYRDTMAVQIPPEYVLLDLLKNDPENEFFNIINTNPGENAGDVMNMSFSDAEKELNRLESENRLEWSKYRSVSIPNIARIPSLGSPILELGGSPDVINAINYSFGPSWRMVIDLQDEIQGYGVYPGGQSGDPRSIHYKDFLDKWVKGDYRKLIKAKVENGSLILN